MPQYPVPPLSQQRIENYIAANPGCSVRTLTDELGLTANSVWQCIRRLRRMGKIRKAFIPDEKRMCWEIGAETEIVEPEGNPRDGQPDQRTVSTWEKDDIAQQSWLSSIMNG